MRWGQKARTCTSALPVSLFRGKRSAVISLVSVIVLFNLGPGIMGRKRPLASSFFWKKKYARQFGAGARRWIRWRAPQCLRARPPSVLLALGVRPVGRLPATTRRRLDQPRAGHARPSPPMRSPAKTVYYKRPRPQPWLAKEHPELAQPASRGGPFAQGGGRTQNSFARLDRELRFDEVWLCGDPSQFPSRCSSHFLDTPDFTLAYLDHTSVIFRRGGTPLDHGPARRPSARSSPCPWTRRTSSRAQPTKLLAIRRLDEAKGASWKQAQQLNASAPDVWTGWSTWHMLRGEMPAAIEAADKAPGARCRGSSRRWPARPRHSTPRRNSRPPTNSPSSSSPNRPTIPGHSLLPRQARPRGPMPTTAEIRTPGPTSSTSPGKAGGRRLRLPHLPRPGLRGPRANRAEARDGPASASPSSTRSSQGAAQVFADELFNQIKDRTGGKSEQNDPGSWPIS